ncbi:oxidoreductase [Leptospira kobayashii]|uniref:Oxidoreductase n=1 Tax=Leptospira kobayashii TaxID=1917830 RepID=A0ABM7UN66_9LEPT|nr:SDR family oxidoreductase [Leptospira kobayashii]BDA80553.1 oxidoreductase [Leptospira kobayashii]
MRFKDKVILITGGNSGIGLSTAKRLASEGAKVAITGRDKDALDKAVKELGSNSLGIVADVTKLEDLDRMYITIKEKYGKLDGIFANAGTAAFIPISDITEESYDQLMNTNVKGVYFTLQKAIPYLLPGSAIVLNASVVASKGNAGTSVYAATKAAVRSMARTFSGELSQKNIRVNVVSPGPIETPLWKRGMTPVPDEALARIAQGVPIKRFGTEEEIAASVAFLLSEDSTYIYGVELNVDGGTSQI